MKKKLWKSLLITTAMLFIGAAADACASDGANSGGQSTGNSEQSSDSGQSSGGGQSSDSGVVETPATLVNFKDEALEVGYGAMYDLELMATDSEGKTYAVKGEVVKKDGTPVETLNGKFVVEDKNGYVITYSVTFAGETVTRKVTLTVKALKKPIVSLTGSLSVVMLGNTCTLPTAEGYDYFDGDLSVTAEVYKRGEETDAKLEYDADNGTFTPTETGDYYVVYTASNSADVAETVYVDFYVRKQVFVSNENTPKTVVPATLETVYNNDITEKFVENGEGSELATLKGGYTGNAVRLSLSNNAGYNFKNTYTALEIADFAEKYNTVSFYIAATGMNGGTAYLMNKNGESNTFSGLATKGTNFPITPDMMGQWFKFSVSMEEYISLLEQTNFDYVNIFNSWLNKVTFPDLNENGALDANERGFYYVGDMEFSYEAPTVVEINETSYVRIKNNDKTETYIANGAGSAIENFTGGYTGNAVHYTGNGNRGYRAQNDFTLEQLETIKTMYNSVSMWIAVDNIASGNQGMHYDWIEAGTFLSKAVCKNKDKALFTAEDNGVWYKYTVSIAEFIKLCTTTDETTGETVVNDSFYLFLTYPNNLIPLTDANGDGEMTAHDCNVYVGDIFFENIEIDPYIVKVSPYTASFISYNANDRYVANGEGSEIAGFTGGYTGNAVALSAVNNENYKVRNSLSLEDIEQLRKNYNSVSMWIAVDNIAEGVVLLHSNPSAGKNNFVNLAYKNGASGRFDANTNGAWKKYTLSIDEYITLITTTVTNETTGETTTTVNDYFHPFRPYPSGVVALVDKNGDGVLDIKDVNIYVGDICFENVTAE